MVTVQRMHQRKCKKVFWKICKQMFWKICESCRTTWGSLIKWLRKTSLNKISSFVLPEKKDYVIERKTNYQRFGERFENSLFLEIFAKLLTPCVNLNGVLCRHFVPSIITIGLKYKDWVRLSVLDRPRLPIDCFCRLKFEAFLYDFFLKRLVSTSGFKVQCASDFKTKNKPKIWVFQSYFCCFLKIPPFWLSRV